MCMGNFQCHGKWPIFSVFYQAKIVSYAAVTKMRRHVGEHVHEVNHDQSYCIHCV